MGDERDNDQSGDEQQREGPTSQSSTSPQSEFDQQGGGMSGQPIGGNDSNTGSGTTLTSGYTPPSAGYEQRLASDGTGAVSANQGRDSATHAGREGGRADFGGQSSSGQTQTSGGSGDTLTADQDDELGRGTTSNAGGSAVGTDQTSGGSSGTSGGEGFIGAQGTGSDDYLQQGGAGSSSSASTTGGSDFAKQGRGAVDDEDEDESGAGSTGGSGSSS
jgi:hypothetical protein